MIKAVIFDVDGTLYDYDSAHAVGMEALDAYVGRKLNMDPASFRAAYKKTMKEVSNRMGLQAAAIHDRYLRFQIMAETEGFAYSPHVLAMTDLYWNTLLDAMRPQPGIGQALERLRAGGYRLGVGTNMMVDYQLRKLERLGMLNMFDFIVTSEEALAEKPEPGFFRKCVEKAHAEPEECLFVGDDPVLDYGGAVRAGLKGLWFRAEGREMPEGSEIPFITEYGQLEMFL